MNVYIMSEYKFMYNEELEHMSISKKFPKLILTYGWNQKLCSLDQSWFLLIHLKQVIGPLSVSIKTL